MASIVIAGIARDVARRLSAVERFIARLRDQVSDVRVVVFESRSQDDTRARLASWAERDPHVELLGDGTDRGPSGDEEPARFQRLAIARNAYVDRLRASRFRGVDFAIVVDLDFVDYLPAIPSIVSAIARPDFDVLTGNTISFHALGGRITYFDSLAFREATFSMRHDPEAIFREKGHIYFDLRRLEIFTVSTKYSPASRVGLSITPESSRSTKLLSAFGGIAIYRRDVLVRFEYDEHTRDCEHVGLHRAMRNAGYDRIYLDPEMIILKDPLIGKYRAWYRAITAR